MPISATPRPSGSSGNAPAVTNGKALAVVTTIFFMWGFLTCLNDILIPHLKAVFELNYAKAMLVQFTFFGTYFLMSLPAGRLVAALGYKKGIVAGLVIAGIGALGFWPAAELRVYGAFLGALFVLATGITVLQVAANLCRAAGPGADQLQPPDPGAGAELAGHGHRPDLRRHADPVQHGQER